MDSSLAYLASLATLQVFRRLPRRFAALILDMLATAAFRADVKHRHIAHVNLRIAFPELSDEERDRIGVQSFRNTARNLLEVSRFDSLTRDTISRLVRYDPQSGLNNYEEARSRGKGILYITGHFSAWELLPTAHALFGYPLAFITRPLDNKRLEGHLRKLRQASGNQVLSKKNSARQILEILKANGSIGILMDQNTSLQEAVFADFFGIPAATTSSVALLALRTDATVLPGYLTPPQEGRYTIKFLPPVELERTGDMGVDIQTNTERFNRVMEGIIREQPASWLWGHKRWRNQPPGHPQDLYALSRAELDRFLAGTQRRTDGAGRAGP